MRCIKHHITLIAAYFVVMLVVVGCNDMRTPIPDYPVLLDINLAADATEVVPVLGYKCFITPRKVNEYLGYGGILVYHTVNVEGCPYVAFDLSCPHEAIPNIRLRICDDGTAVCDSCGSVYMLLDGTGFATAGPTRHKLRRYNVAQLGYDLFIRR